MYLITYSIMSFKQTLWCAINLGLPPLVIIVSHYISKSLDFKGKNDLRLDTEREDWYWRGYLTKIPFQSLEYIRLLSLLTRNLRNRDVKCLAKVVRFHIWTFHSTSIYWAPGIMLDIQVHTSEWERILVLGILQSGRGRHVFLSFWYKYQVVW